MGPTCGSWSYTKRHGGYYESVPRRDHAELALSIFGGNVLEVYAIAGS